RRPAHSPVLAPMPPFDFLILMIGIRYSARAPRCAALDVLSPRPRYSAARSLGRRDVQTGQSNCRVGQEVWNPIRAAPARARSCLELFTFDYTKLRRNQLTEALSLTIHGPMTRDDPAPRRSRRRGSEPAQLVLFKKRGGKRRGAGRPPKGKRAGSPHSVERRIDHFALDPAGKRLFVAALGNGTLEVLDVDAGKRI